MYCSIFKQLNLKLFIECANSDGLMGFYYSHDGFWAKGYTYQGSKTKVECANTCMHDCVGINTYATTSTGNCYHYSKRDKLVSADIKINSGTKAYVKCLGRNE